MAPSPLSIAAIGPLRKHYGFAIFSDGAELATHLEIAAHLKQAHLNAYITWFASEENVASIRQSHWVDQVVILPGDPASLGQAVERLRHDRPWVKFYPLTAVTAPSAIPVPTSVAPARSALPILTPCSSLSVNPTGPKVLLGQLGLNGDCLYTTTLARQIKHDFPNCHLTWVISSFCRSMIEENPYVDEIWEIPAKGWKQIEATWHWLVYEVVHQLEQGRFDHAFMTQVYPYNLRNFDGTVRPSIFRNYPGQITVPVQNILRLRTAEVANVKAFADRHQLPQCPCVILFEYSSSSAQCYLDLDYALAAAQEILALLPDCRIIMSSHKPLPPIDPRILDASTLSLRENAELTKYCHLFIGCSSGITQIVLTDWAKPLPMIQLLASSTSVYASVAHDFEYWGLPCDLLLEMADAPVKKLVDCIKTIIEVGFVAARQQFHQSMPLHFAFYLMQIQGTLLNFRQYSDTAQAIEYAVTRYGWHPELVAFVQDKLFPLRAMKTTQPSSEEDWLRFLRSCRATQTEDDPLPDFHFSSLNLIAFPDWQQPTHILIQDLQDLLYTVLNHYQVQETTLFIATHQLPRTQVNELLVDTTMEILMTQIEEWTIEPTVEIVPWLSEYHWLNFIAYLQARITLLHEDIWMVTYLAANLPIFV